MINTLLKKQFKSFFNAFMRGGGVKMKNKKTGNVVIAVLLLYVVAAFGFLFFMMMDSLCKPLVSAGLDWLYFAYATIVATALAIIGSVFMAESSLFDAKDNELLLSLPIKPGHILLCRMIPLYVQNLAFDALVLIPAFVVYAINVPLNAVKILSWVLLLFAIPLFALAICAVLGWIIALLSTGMRNKNIIRIVLSLGFLGAYFWIYTKANHYLQLMILNSSVYAVKVKKYLYIFYRMGKASGEGNVLSLLIYVGIILALFALVYAIISKSYIKIITTKRGEKKRIYTEKKVEAVSAEKAVFRKELNRFFGSATYLINCGLGTILLTAAVVLIIVKFKDINAVVATMPFLSPLLPLFICAITCFITSMDVVTAPSVSLEGKSLWILRSLPISSYKILMQKMKLHYMVNGPIALIFTVFACVIFKTEIFASITAIILPQLLIYFFGALGLRFNFKYPNLDWDTEVAAVKQGTSVMLAIFSGMGVITGMIIVYVVLAFAVKITINSAIFMGAFCVIFLIFDILLNRWLKSTGVKKFEELS